MLADSDEIICHLALNEILSMRVMSDFPCKMSLMLPKTKRMFAQEDEPSGEEGLPGKFVGLLERLECLTSVKMQRSSANW